MLTSFLSRHNIRYSKFVSLKTKTWIKTGGVAEFWITPNEIQELIDLGTFLYQNNINFELVGSTSNIFFKDEYNPNIVISTRKLNRYEETSDSIVCECGVNVAKLSKDCVTKGYQGFYGLINLPGTVAASVYNNAGCFECSISERLELIQLLSMNGETITLLRDDLGFLHRSSALKRDEIKGIILTVKLKKEDAISVSKEIECADTVTQIRKHTQEGAVLNLGSIYSNCSYRINVINIVGILLIKILGRFHIIKNINKAIKKTMLNIYGYRYLDDYISDKSLNTFIWRDEEAECMFEQYQHFMNKVYTGLTIEIEIKK